MWCALVDEIISVVVKEMYLLTIAHDEDAPPVVVGKVLLHAESNHSLLRSLGLKIIWSQRVVSACSQLRARMLHPAVDRDCKGTALEFYLLRRETLGPVLDSDHALSHGAPVVAKERLLGSHWSRRRSPWLRRSGAIYSGRCFAVNVSLHGIMR